MESDILTWWNHPEQVPETHDSLSVCGILTSKQLTIPSIFRLPSDLITIPTRQLSTDLWLFVKLLTLCSPGSSFEVTGISVSWIAVLKSPNKFFSYLQPPALLLLLLFFGWQYFLFFFFFFVLFAFSRATAAAYGGFQARGLIEVVAASLHHSHSNVRSIQAMSVTYTHSSRQRWIINPLSKARHQIHNLVVPSRIRFCCTTMRTPKLTFSKTPRENIM